MMQRTKVWTGIACLVLLPLVAACGSKREMPPPSPAEGREETPAAGEEESRTGAVPESPPERDVGLDHDFANIHFEFDKHRLTPEAQRILAGHAKVLMDHASWRVRIEGHCDERGTVEYNLALGEKRAEGAKDFLVRYGVRAANVSIVSYGKERPVDPRHSEEAWAANRRDVFEVTR